LDRALDDLGWGDALAADPAVAVGALFGDQGSAGATSSALDRVLAAALGLDLASGGAGGPPPLGRGGPPGGAGGDGVAGRGLGTAGLGGADRLAVATGSDLVVVAPGDLTLRTVEGLDPDLGLVEVTGSLAQADARTPLSPSAWAAAVAAGQRALAHELVGASRTMLELARTHALDRIQFGRPIAAFQAVRHRLAESLVAIEGADAAVAAAWDDPSPLAAGLAKALAGRSARTVARHSHQAPTRIGFTTHPPLPPPLPP